jgi:sterol desaturase/sphingolipid hydroxylase (fatty acid hydroxylase superfamily)
MGAGALAGAGDVAQTPPFPSRKGKRPEASGYSSDDPVVTLLWAWLPMQDELLIRLSVFLGVFAALAVLERTYPRRRPLQPNVRRRTANLALAVIDAIALRAVALALPILAVVATADAASLGLGLFNPLDWPLWQEFLLAVLALDFAIWLQHLVTHKVPFFWRFHRVHHADRDFDVTTALCFHPVEIIASAGLRLGLVYLLGPSALAVLAFEILLNATALFNHSNLALPRPLDRLVRLMLVTPDMHRVHHSVHREEHDSNYGFALSVRDRVFRTYRPQPKADRPTMPIGLHWQDDRPMRPGWMLTLPFRR